MVDWRIVYREIRVERISSDARRLAREYSYRPYMVQRYIEMLGYDETLELLKAFEKKPKPVIRCNDLRVECKWLMERLEELGFKLEHIDWSLHGYRVLKEPRQPSLGATHEYLKGYYYIHRDSPPLIPGLLLEGDREPRKVLDTCAAPGGKATHLAQLMSGEGLVVANDLVLYRLVALVSHVLRMGFRNIVVTWSDLKKLPRLLETRFARVLVDAPCSGEGVIMFDPSRKFKTTQKDLAVIVAREIGLLEAALELLEPNGLLAYVTCSIALEENEYVVSKILARNPSIKVVKPPVKLFKWSSGVKEYMGLELDSSVRECIRVWPHIHGTMGMTICLLTKT